MKKIISIMLIIIMVVSITACTSSKKKASDSKSIESELNLMNNKDQEWTYTKDSDSWALSVVTAVTNPEIPDQQGVSVCVPGTYITGIDTDGDGEEDVTSDNYEDSIKGSLVINNEAEIISSNGQTYTAETAPVILNTGAAGYGSQTNSVAASSYASEGYINIACGNRGKQDTVKGDDGETIYTGDAPSCLIDQKSAARFVKYNILLGNLPGSVDHFVSTGGSGGGAHAAMFAATSNNPDYYDYQIEAGAVGVYQNSDGSYSTSVTIDGKEYELSDGAWGTIAYSAITSLSEADTAMAFEYYMNTDYDFSTSFQAQLAEYLSKSYMEYINEQNLSVEESAVGFDLNDDGDTDDKIDLTIEYDKNKYANTNGYYGSYLDLYMAEFQQNLQWYLDNLDYSEGWTWFDEDGNALSDDEVKAMSSDDKATAFINGRYAKSSSSDEFGAPGNDAPTGDSPSGNSPDGAGAPNNNTTSDSAMRDGPPDMSKNDSTSGGAMDGNGVGTPNAGTTQSGSGSTDSANYDTYDDMVKSYKEDIQSINDGDKYGKNIVSLYNPLEYIGNEDTENPTWTKIIMGASEGDISMFNSLNLQIAWLNAGVDSQIEWQWDGGHVPSETLGDSFSLYIDQMYGKYVDGATEIVKKDATKQTKNGTETNATGTDISSWVTYKNSTASFSLADAVSYRTNSASKAIPGFDVLDYGQEDYVFGNSEQDARHWNQTLLDIFEKYSDELSGLFNQS